MALEKVDFRDVDAWAGFSTDAKPASAKIGSLFYELDTGIPWRFGSGGWWKIRAGDQPFDRNGVSKVLMRYEATGVGPHAQTSRAQYIVPAGKKTQIQFSSFSVMRSAAAGALGIEEVWWMITPASGGLETRASGNFQNSNTVGNGLQVATLSLPVMVAGDQLTAYTRSTSTTTSLMDYRMGVIGIEYDA